MSRLLCIRCSPGNPCVSCPNYVDYMVVELFVSAPPSDDMSALASSFECEKCGPTYCDKCPNKE